MVNVDDPSDYEGRYQRAKAKLDRIDDVNEKDRKAIKALMARRDTAGDYKPSTQGTLLNQLIRCAQITEKPLHQYEQSPYDSDLDDFMNTLETEYDFSESYARSFKQALRTLFQHLGKDWADDIHVGSPEPGKITEDDCFTSDETARMFAAANTRDSAIIALMLATGQRITAVASLRLSDIQIEGNQRGGFYLNPEAVGLKGAEGYRPMIWATPYVARWLNGHPHWPEQRDSDDVALFVTLNHGKNYDYGDNLGYDGFKKVVNRVGKDAGIDSDKVNAHRFRHTAIRKMIRDGLSDQRIKYMVGWHADSTHLQRYGSLSDKSQAKDIEDHYGISPKKPDSVDGDEKVGTCPGCDTPLSDLTGASFCPSCGVGLTHSSQQIEDAVERSLWESKAKAEDEQTEKGIDLLKELDDDESVRTEIMEQMKGELLSEILERLDNQ